MLFSGLYSQRLAKGMFFLLIFSLFTVSACANSFYEASSEPWGVDSEFTHKQKDNKTSSHSFPRKTCRAMIRFFQVYISPIDGPRSSFYPTSSQFALEAIEKYGVFQGIALGCDRLLRENSDNWVYERTNKYGSERKLDPVR